MWLLRRQSNRTRPLAAQEVDSLSWPSKARLVWRLVQDSRVPVWARGLAVVPALYLLSPIDLLPDFIPFLGRLDDALVFSLISDLLLRFVPAHVLHEHTRALAPAPRPRR
jgi:uncharacterized membrane protein YkvA (DUF1232 family)